MNNTTKKNRDFYPAVKMLDQPFGSMPRCCNSFRSTRLIQVAREVSPSALAASSSWALNSSGRRIWYGGERFSNGVDMVITLNYYSYMVITIVLTIIQKATPQTVRAVPGRLTTTLSEVTSWLLRMIPKLTLNLHGVFSPWVNSLIRSSVLQLPLSARRVQKRPKDVSAFWRAGSVLRR